MNFTIDRIQSFAALGRVFQGWTVNFANTITDANTLTLVTEALQQGRGRKITKLIDVTQDEDGTFRGEFQQYVNPRLTKRFKFVYGENELSFTPLNGDDIQKFSEQTEDFARQSKSRRAGTSMNCRIEQCGGRCLKSGETCRLTPTPEQKKLWNQASGKNLAIKPETSLARKRRETAEAKRKERLGVASIEKTIEQGKQFETDMKTVAKRIEKGFKELGAPNVTNLNSKRRAKDNDKNQKDTVDIKAASKTAGVDEKAVKTLHDDYKSLEPAELKDYAKIVGIKTAKKTHEQLALELAIKTQQAKEAKAKKQSSEGVSNNKNNNKEKDLESLRQKKYDTLQSLWENSERVSGERRAAYGEAVEKHLSLNVKPKDKDWIESVETQAKGLWEQAGTNPGIPIGARERFARFVGDEHTREIISAGKGKISNEAIERVFGEENPVGRASLKASLNPEKMGGTGKIVEEWAKGLGQTGWVKATPEQKAMILSRLGVDGIEDLGIKFKKAEGGKIGNKRF